MVKLINVAVIAALFMGCDTVDVALKPGSALRESQRGERYAATITEPAIDASVPLVVKAGDTVTLKGTDFDVYAHATVEGEEVALNIISGQELSFVMPVGPTGRSNIKLIQGDYTADVKHIFIVADDKYPFINADQANICNDLSYYNAEGNVVQGTRICGLASNYNELTPENIRLGVVINGMVGKLESILPDCSHDGEVDCRVVAPTFAAAKTTGAASKIIVGQTLAGVSGQVVVPAAAEVRASASPYGVSGSAIIPTLVPCAGAGLTGCLTTVDYKSQDLTAAAGEATALTETSFTDGSLGSSSITLFEFWTRTGQRVTAAPSPTLRVENIKLGKTIGGVVGDLELKPDCVTTNSQTCKVPYGGSYYAARACSIEGLSNCYLPPYVSGAKPYKTINFDSFSSINKKYVSAGKSLVGVTGTLTLPSAGSVCAANGSYGVGGTETAPTISECTTGSAGCCIAGGTTPTSAAVTTASVDPNEMLTSYTLGGVAGKVSLPSEINVNSTVNYGANSALAGKLELPSETKVYLNQHFGNYNGSSYNSTGSLKLPSISQVLRLVNGSGTVINKYGPNGTGLTPSLATCAAAGVTGCITSATYPSQNLSSSGTGTTTLATTHFSSGDLGTRNGAPVTFEYWQRDGSRVTATSSDALSGVNILSGKSILGVAGTVSNAPSDCGGSTFSGCSVDGTNFVAAQKTVIQSSNIRNGVVISGVTGDYPSASNKLPLSSAGMALTSSNFYTNVTGGSQFEWYDASGSRYVGTGSSITTNVVKNGTTVFGVLGTYSPTCASDGGSSCYVDSTSNYIAASKTTAVAGNIKSGVSLAGVTGSYPSSSAPLSGSSGTDLTTSNFNSLLASAGTFQWFDGEGARYSATGSTILTAGVIKDGATLYGVTGVYGKPCDQDGLTECSTSSSYVAAHKTATALNTSNIKLGVTIGGVTGLYGTLCADGGTNCLVDGGASGTVVAANKAALVAGNIKNGVTISGVAGTFGATCASDGGSNCVADGTTYIAANKVNAVAGNIRSGVAFLGTTGTFGVPCTSDGGTNCVAIVSNGNGYVAASMANLVAENVHKGVSLAGVTGTFGDDCTAEGQETPCMTTTIFKAADTTNFGVWDLRVGKTLLGVTGKLDFFKNMSKSAPATTTSTVDDYANGTAFPLLAATGWRVPAADVWTCSGTETDAICKDELTGLTWSYADRTLRNWNGMSGAIQYCEILTKASITTWRLPTQKELMQAYIDGIWRQKSTLGLDVGVTGFNKSDSVIYWSSTSFSSSSSDAWYVLLHKGFTNGDWDSAKTTTNMAICVSP